KALAQKFINYILDAKVSADLINATHYPHPIPSALQYVDALVQQNPSVFIPEKDLKKLHFVMDLGDNVSLYDEAWQEIKR
ncbi:spermidine/putrescine ABC transporter substrate-binding protein, partial [Candidatus Peregrinibacteria bacterium]|nr:spermidine/putrescine ABC transporter substrate-binding protein [Candidatus Peregrinibacteria bacterium]